VHAAVEGIAQACVAQPDQMLYDLLASAIGECVAWCSRQSGLSIRRDIMMAAAH
jgi:hypothetical protein